MFDMGFLELLLIGIIALIVLGPERLPKAARTVGLWIAKAKQGFESVKSEIDRELKVQELQQQIKDQKEQLEQDTGLSDLKGSINETQSILEDDFLKNNANSILNESNSTSDQIIDSAKDIPIDSPINGTADNSNKAQAKISSDEGNKND